MEPSCTLTSATPEAPARRTPLRKGQAKPPARRRRRGMVKRATLPDAASPEGSSEPLLTQLAPELSPERRRAARRRLETSRRTGGDLLSQGVAPQVPSALKGLTALFGMGRGVSPSPKPPEKRERPPPRSPESCTEPHRVSLKNPSSPRPISTGLLRVLPPFQIRPINLVVYQGSYSLEGMGELISRSASRLDAFSGYPIRT